MNLPALFPNLVPLVTLLVGVGLGWALSASHHHRRHASGPSERDRLEMHVDDSEDAVHQAEVELARLDVRANILTQSIASMRLQIDDSQREHDRLLVALDERQESVKDARHNLDTIDQSLETRNNEANRLMQQIDKSIEELDMLNQMKDNYAVKINRLTQQVQWQDGELRMLRQTMKTRSAEIDEERAALDQRDGELRLLNRQRQQREIDIEHARQALAQRDAEFRRQVASSGSDAFGSARQPARLPRDTRNNPDQFLPGSAGLPRETRTNPDQLGSTPELRAGRRIDVTPPDPAEPQPAPAGPPVPPRVRPAPPTPEPDDDDLTVIPRLSDYYARQLKDKGIRTIRQLAALSEDEVRRLLHIPEYHNPNIDSWLKAARKLTRKSRPQP